MMTIKVKATKKYLQVDNKTPATKETIKKDWKLDKKMLLKETKEIAEAIGRQVTTNIFDGKKYTGGNVAKLRPATVKKKGHGIPLLDTGKLRAGVVVKRDGDGFTIRMSNARYKGGDTVSNVATYLNEGSPKMVARPFFGVTEKQINKIVKNAFKDR